MSFPAGSHPAFTILQKKANIKSLCIICFPIPSFDLTSIFKIRFPLQIAWILPQGMRTTSLHALILMYMTKYVICTKKLALQSPPLSIISFCWAPEKKMPPKCFCEIFVEIGHSGTHWKDQWSRNSYSETKWPHQKHIGTKETHKNTI